MSFGLTSFALFGALSDMLPLARGLLGLGFVIFVHELGHFLVAKACGVKCEKFYVGFDVPIQLGPIKFPSALFKKQWGETEYGIGIVPLGGYVKMLGQDDNPGNQAKENERMRDEQGALDPRSYPAKSVPQRMAIISAGVIMNLIFAVIFAAAAYLMGVKYTPCKIGSTMPGDPAWQMNLQPGDQIVQLGKDGERNEHLRFSYDLRFNVIKVGEGNDCDMLIRHSDGSEEWITVQPSTPLKKETGFPTIGVTAASSNILSEPMFELDTPYSATDLKDGERIVGMAFGDQQYPVETGEDIDRLLVQHAGETAMLQVAAKPEDGQQMSGETRSVELGARLRKFVGIEPVMGKVVAVQKESPAAKAGLQEGDLLTTINGEPVGNPLTLEDRIKPFVGQLITLGVRRDANDIEIEISPRQPVLSSGVRYSRGPAGLDTLGVAFEATRKIARVNPASSAAQEGLQAGDEIIEARLVPAKDDEKTAKMLASRRLNEPIKIEEDDASWQWFAGIITDMPDGTRIEVKVRRGKDTKLVSLSPSVSTEFFDSDRGLPLEATSLIRTAGSFSEALTLGVRETKEGIGQVIFTLRRIKDLFTKLGGPITIAAAAKSESSQGFPRLLIFLTLLSANLAVLNFLPIPVLDGGHMMFLAYEGLVGKPVNERIAFGLTMLGLSFILGLMVFVIGMDFYRFLV